MKKKKVSVNLFTLLLCVELTVLQLFLHWFMPVYFSL